MYRLPTGEMSGKEIITTKTKFESIEKYILDNPR